MTSTAVIHKQLLLSSLLRGNIIKSKLFQHFTYNNCKSLFYSTNMSRPQIYVTRPDIPKEGLDILRQT